jgi:hypothetical protein
MSQPPESRQINFTIVPAETPAVERVYANFCAVANTPFDFTLTFCEVQPLSPQDVQQAERDHIVAAPVKARVVVPVPFIPTMIAALQEHLRAFTESQKQGAPGWSGDPIH